MTDQSPGSHESATSKRISHEKLLLVHRNLVVRLQYIDQNSLNTDFQQHVHKELEDSLSALRRSLSTKEIGDDAAWIEIYAIEQQIGQLLSGERLRQEIEARLSESQGIPGAQRFGSEYERLEKHLSKDISHVVTVESAADTIRRDFLRRVLEHSQWFYRTQYLARPMYLEATRDILYFVLGAMALVAAPYAVLVFFGNDTIASFLLSARGWEMLPLYTALSVGFLGACFSRMILLQRNQNMSLDEVLLHREASYIWLRAVVGACGALVVFFFLRSGIVNGQLFPDLELASIQEFRPAIKGLTNAALPMVLVPSRDLALLMVWSFIAGFSEALVPTILTRSEGQLSNAATVEKK